MLLNQTTAIVQVYISVRKPNYWPKHVIPRYDGCRCTHFNYWQWSHLRLTSLCHQQQQTLSQHSRKMAYEERDEATSLYISYMVYMIITQTRCTMALSLAVILEERRHHSRPSVSGSPPQEINLQPAHNAKSESNLCLGVLIRLLEIRSSPISVRLRCIHAF